MKKQSQKRGWLAVGGIYVLMVWGNIFSSKGVLATGLSPLAYLITLMTFLSAYSVSIAQSCNSTFAQPVVKNVDNRVSRLAIAGLAGLLVQMILGFSVRGTQSGLACPEFPNCQMGFFPDPFTFESGLVFFHRWWAILMLGHFARLAIITAKKCPELATPARRVLGLSVAQIFIGVGAVMSHLETGSRATHAAVGYALWGILFFITYRSGGIHQLWNKKAY